MESGAVYHAALHSDAENTKLEIHDELQKAVTALLTESPEQYGAFYQAFMDSAELRSRFESDIFDAAMQQVKRTEAAREAAAAARIPFSERLSEGVEDEINPYVYDGSMSIEDFRQMQTELLNNELPASRRTPEMCQHFLHDDITAAL